MRIAIVFTCHNRSELTERCLLRLKYEIINNSSNNEFKIFVCDDNSTDNTSTILKKYEVEIIKGDGNLFWARGMCKAIKLAENYDPDFYLLINDDVDFYSGMIEILLNEFNEKRSNDIAIVGATQDSLNGKYTYGGYTWNGKYIRKNYRKVLPTDIDRRCKEANWNCFLLPKELYKKIGKIDSFYEHGFADFDYTNRITKAGYNIYVAKDYIGKCDRNKKEGTYLDTTLSMLERFSLINKRTVHPIKSATYYAIKYYGICALFFIIKPYLYVFFTSLIKFVDTIFGRKNK